MEDEYLWKGSLNIVKISVVPNLIYRSNIIPIKIPASYFVNIDKLTLKCTWRGKRPRVNNSYRRRRTCRELILPNFKTYYKAAIIKH